MDLPANLYITQKGVDEVKLRMHKLGMKKRSVLLLLLDTPKNLLQILNKSVFPEHEVRQEVSALIGEGYIATNGEGAPRPEAPRPAELAAGAVIVLDDEIILSEAKFLLADFAVDSFGTQSQAVVDAIRACTSVADFRLCLTALLASVEKKCPKQLPALRKLVEDINETA